MGDTVKTDYPALTAVRGVLALAVVLFHFHSIDFLSHLGIVRHGYMAVSVFFVLSGFILTKLYAHRKFTPADFYLARFGRVYPAYALGIIFSAPLAINYFLKTSQPLRGLGELGLTALCLQSWNSGTWHLWNEVGWSICCEAFFYLVFPLLLLPLARMGQRTLLSSAAACTLLALLGSGHLLSALDIDGKWVHPQSPFIRLPEFVLGMIAALVAPGAALRRSHLWAAGSMVAAVAITQLVPPELQLHGVLALPAAICLRALCEPSTYRTPDVLVWLGRVSFPLYLFHLTTWTYLTRILAPSPLLELAAVSLSLLVAHLCHRHFEDRARRFVIQRLSRQVAN